MSAVAAAARRARDVRVTPRTLRRAALVLALLAAAGFGVWQWLQDSSLVTVKRVTVVGVQGAGRTAEQLRAALVDAAHGQSTLDLDVGRLRRVAAAFPAVRDIRVAVHPPHAVEVRVVPRPVLAVVRIAGQRVGVAPDGTLLAAVPLPPRLPTVAIGSIPLDASGGRLNGPRQRAALRLLAAAPRGFRPALARVDSDRVRGLVVALRRGPTLVFGSGDRAAAKWAAAIRVLADPDAAGARWVDVRLPERPAVSGGTVAAPPSPTG